MSTLSTNQIVVEYIIKEGDIQKAQQNFDKLTTAEKQAVVQTQKLNQTLKDTGTEGKKATDEIAGGLKNVSGIAGKLGPLLAGAFSVAAISAFTKQILQTTAQFQQYQKVLDFTAGSAKQGAVSFQFLKDTSERLGISLIAAVEGYKTLSGAATQAGLSNNQTRQIFDNVAKSVAAFGLSADDAKGVFLALGQIISKGTVSAEELRGQIGERIPGAFAIAARSIGKTEAELNKMLQTGQVTSRDFVIPFTQELAKAAAAADGPDGLTQKVNRISNAFEVLKTRLGQGLLGPTSQVGNLLERALNLANKLLETQADKQAVVNTRAYEKATKDAANATEEALKISIANQNAKIRLAKTEFDLINERVTIDGKLTDDEEDQINRQRILIQQLQAYRDGLFDALKGRKEIKTEIIQTEAELKKELELELARLKALTEIRKIEQDSIAGKLGADRAYYEAAGKLLIEYKEKGVSISEEEIKLNKAKLKQTTHDLIEQGKIDQMENKQNLSVLTKDTDEALAAQNEARIKRMKEWSDMYEQDQKEQAKIAMQAEAEKAKAVNMYYNLLADSVQNFANIQQQRIQNEITLLNRRYDEEIRLAGDNKQKVMELENKRQAEEKALRRKAFEAQRQAAIAEVIFRVAPIIAQQIAGVITAPLAIASYATAATQIAFIAAQPVPEFKEGTKGKPFKGGKAIVGEIGKEWVVTTSGTVYETPGTATLVDLPKGSQVIPHHEVVKSERFMGSKLFGQSKSDSATGQIVERLISLENTMSKLPITSLTMDERGFTKKIQTKSRETKILNNRFGN